MITHNFKTFDSCFIRPIKHSVMGVERVNLENQIAFRNGKLFTGIPLMVDSVTNPEEVKKNTALGIMSGVTTFGSVPDMVDYFDQEETHYTMFPIVAEEDLDFFDEIWNKVRDQTKIKYVVYMTDYLHDPFSAIRNFKEVYQYSPVLIAGSAPSAELAVEFEQAGADAVIVGIDAGAGDFYGVDVLPLELLTDCTLSSLTAPIVAGLNCQSPSDVIKCLVGGADFVMIEETHMTFSVGEIIQGIQGACGYVGVDSIGDLYFQAELSPVRNS